MSQSSLNPEQENDRDPIREAVWDGLPDGHLPIVVELAHRRVRRKRLDIVTDLAGEALALALGLALAWFSGMVWLVERGGADVTAMVPNASRWFASSFDGRDADIGSLRVVVAPEDDRLTLLGADITVRDRNGAQLDRLEKLRLDTGLNAALTGRSEVRALTATGGTVSIVRDGDVWKAGLGRPGALGRLGPVVELGGEGGGASLPLADLTEVTVFIRDDSQGLDWRVDNVRARISQTSGTRIRMAGRLTAGGAAAPMTLSYRNNGKRSEGSLALRTDAPDAFATTDGPLAQLRRVRIPIEALRVTRSTGERDVIDVELEAGGGEIRDEGSPIPVRKIDLTAQYLPAEQRIRIDDFDADAAGMQARGRATLDLQVDDEGLEQLDADIDLARLRMEMASVPRGDVVLETPSARLSWRPRADTVSLRGFNMGLEGARLLGDATVIFDAGNRPKRITTETRLEGSLSPETLMSLWPEGFVGGARRWIDRSVLEGRIENVRLVADVDERAFAGETAMINGELQRPALPEEAMELTFDVRDGVVKYISTMTPMRGASGRGILRGNSLVFNVEAGQVGELGVREARIDMPVLVPKGGDFTIDVRGQGSAPRLLELIDQEPFRYASRYNLDPSEFAGQGEVELTITRPLREYFDDSDISYAVKGRFEDMTIPFELGGQTLSDASISLEADATRLALSGPVKFGPWQAQLDYLDTLGDDGSTPTTAKLSGLLSRDALDSFGIGLRQYFDGEVPVEIDAVSDGLNLLYANISTDLTPATLSIDPYYFKAAGLPARASALLGRSSVDGSTSIDELSVTAPSLDISGELTLESDARLREMTLDRMFIRDVMDLSARVVPNSERTRLVATVEGAYIDLSHVVSQRLKNTRLPRADRPAGAPLDLAATFDRVTLARSADLGDYDITGVEGRYDSDGTTVRAAALSGDIDGAPASMTLTPDETGTRELRLTLPDAAGGAQALFGFTGVQGGALDLAASLPPAGSERSVLGEVAVQDLRLTRAPILAQMLSLASLKGLGDTLSGQGIDFDEIESEFAFRDGQLSLRKTRASGPALGLTLEGEIGLRDQLLDINGVLVPAYTANSLLGDIPLLGDILVGEEGEGVFGLNYIVSGPFSAAQVAVNPLSALTPGVFREIFKPQRKGLPENENR